MSKKTLQIAKLNNNEVVVQVKANQPLLLEQCEDIERFIKPKEIYKSDSTKSHGRIEQRTVSIFTDIDIIEDPEWREYIGSVILINRHRETFNTISKKWVPSHEKSHYICTTVLTAIQSHDVIKNHWLIESNNYIRDVCLKEDECKTKTGAAIWARMRSLVLNILRKNKIKSIKGTLYKNSLSLNFLKIYNILLLSDKI